MHQEQSLPRFIANARTIIEGVSVKPSITAGLKQEYGKRDN